MTKQEAEAAAERILDEYFGADNDDVERGAAFIYCEDTDMDILYKGSLSILAAGMHQMLVHLAVENLSSLDAIRTVDEAAKYMMSDVRKRVYDKEWGQKGDGSQ